MICVILTKNVIKCGVARRAMKDLTDAINVLVLGDIPVFCQSNWMREPVSWPNLYTVVLSEQNISFYTWCCGQDKSIKRGSILFFAILQDYLAEMSADKKHRSRLSCDLSVAENY